MEPPLLPPQHLDQLSCSQVSKGAVTFPSFLISALVGVKSLLCKTGKVPLHLRDYNLQFPIRMQIGIFMEAHPQK